MQSLKFLFLLFVITPSFSLPAPDDVDDEAKGLLDGLGSTTAAPTGLGGLGEIAQAKPMMVMGVGSFQGIVTKIGPVPIGGLPVESPVGK